MRVGALLSLAILACIHNLEGHLVLTWATAQRALTIGWVSRVLSGAMLFLLALAPAVASDVRIVRGKPVPPGQAGWQVALLIHNDPFCGGSLVAPDWVLTAAHCLVEQFGTDKARAGFEVAYGSVDAGSRRRIKVIDVRRHENWTGDPRQAADIGLVRLERALLLSEAQVLELADATDFSPSAEVYGWGMTQMHTASVRASTAPMPSRLQRATVSLAAMGSCATQFPEVRRIPVLCAQIDESLRDACEGDSGGPLVIGDSTQSKRQIGIISYGSGCGQAGSYGIYTDVRPYLPWLQTQMTDH